jgi:2'-hydroxyisoflavone reductase
MKLLVLGGTRFLGRHLVEIALARGDDVTIFTRGRTPVPWPSQVSSLAGDRDPRIGRGLAALDEGTFDAVIDCSGYVPRVVGASARLLAPRVSRYVFVSSLSVYASTDRPNLDESTPLAQLDDPANEQVREHYGGLKAACERAVTDAFGERATIVRPGLIVGPYDDTDRFGYWVARFVHPHLLGDRPLRAVVPEPPERPLQVIDARDLAAWMLDLAAADATGVFNAASPAWQWRMSDFVKALKDASPAPPRAAWLPESALLEAGVVPWTGLPLWIPESDRDGAGFMTIDCRRAQAAGLAARALPQTIADTAAWLAARDNANAWRQVLSADVEQKLVSL